MDWYSIERAASIISERSKTKIDERGLFSLVERGELKLSFKTLDHLWVLPLLPKSIEQSRIILSYGGFMGSLFHQKAFIHGYKAKSVIYDHEIPIAIKDVAQSILVKNRTNNELNTTLKKMVDSALLTRKLDPIKDQISAYPESYDFPDAIKRNTDMKLELIPDFEGIVVGYQVDGEDLLVGVLEYQNNYKPIQLPIGVYDLSLIDGGLKDVTGMLRDIPVQVRSILLSNKDESKFYHIVDKDLDNPVVINDSLIAPIKPVFSILKSQKMQSKLIPCLRKCEVERYINTLNNIRPTNKKHTGSRLLDDPDSYQTQIKYIIETFIAKKKRPPKTKEIFKILDSYCSSTDHPDYGYNSITGRYDLFGNNISAKTLGNVIRKITCDVS